MNKEAYTIDEQGKAQPAKPSGNKLALLTVLTALQGGVVGGISAGPVGAAVGAGLGGAGGYALSNLTAREDDYLDMLKDVNKDKEEMPKVAAGCSKQTKPKKKPKLDKKAYKAGYMSVNK